MDIVFNKNNKRTIAELEKFDLYIGIQLQLLVIQYSYCVIFIRVLT